MTSDDFQAQPASHHAQFATFLGLVASNRQHPYRLSSVTDTNHRDPPADRPPSHMSNDAPRIGPRLKKVKPEHSDSDDFSTSFDEHSGIRKELNDIVARRNAAPPPPRSKDDKIIINSVGESRYALLPDHKLRRYWDTFILILVIYVAFVSVFVYSFFGVLGLDSPWFWIERFLDVAFAIDICVSFFAAYERDGFWVKDLPLIRRRYLRKWFIFDVLATVPWDTIALAADVDKSIPHLLQLPRFVRLVRLFKLFRLVKIFQLQQKFTWIEIKLRLKYGYLRLAGLFSTVIFLAHFFACLFYYFGAIGNPGVDESWTTRGIPEDLYGKYITALYFSVYTITTIGYGDIVPISTLERTYTTLIMLLGAACFAYVISQVSNIYSELNASSVQNRVLMDSVIDLQKSRNLPDDLVFDIRRFFKREHLRQRVVTESNLLKGMSRDLRVNVLKHIYGAHLERSRLLRGIPDGHKEDVYFHAEEVFARKDEPLFKQGDRADCFYVIIRGSVKVVEPNKEPVVLTDGYSFGEADVLFNRFRKEEAVCTTYTDLVKVPRTAVMEALERYPDVLEKLRHEEALILWEEAMWRVEQQIRYTRMARSLKEQGREYMRARGVAVSPSPRSPPSSRKMHLAQSAQRGTASQSHSKTGGAGGEAQSLEDWRKMSEEKGRRIEELEQRLKELQGQLSSIVNGFQGI